MSRLLLLLALLLPACAVLDPDQEVSCGLRLRTEVPVTVVRDVPLVVVNINSQPATLILDTGAATMLLTQAAVKRLGLRTDSRGPVSVSGIGGSSRNWPAVVQRFAIGDVALPDQLAAVHEMGLGEVAGIRPDGLLGVDVLGRFEVDLDLPGRRMALHSGRPCEGEPAPFPGRPMEIEAPRARVNKLVIPASLQGRTVRALLDSGSVLSNVITRTALGVGVTEAALQQAPLFMLSGVGPDRVPARLHRFAFLGVGEEAVLGPIMSVAERPADEDDMIIGMDYMAQRRIWLAYPRRRVFIQRLVPARMPVAGASATDDASPRLW